MSLLFEVAQLEDAHVGQDPDFVIFVGGPETDQGFQQGFGGFGQSSEVLGQGMDVLQKGRQDGLGRGDGLKSPKYGHKKICNCLFTYYFVVDLF